MIKVVATVVGCLLWIIPQDAHGKSHRYGYRPFYGQHDYGSYVPSWEKKAIYKAKRKSVSQFRKSQRQKSTKVSIATVLLPHPSGCPKVRFCGCGVSEKVFGKKIKSLYLAANWLKFPKANPAPGMVAARKGHVFYIERVLKDNKVLAYDPNSGGRKTRLWVRSLKGFSVRNPLPTTKVASR